METILLLILGFMALLGSGFLAPAADEVTTTGYSTMINSEWLDPMVADYMLAALVVTPTARVANLAGKGTKVWSTNTRVKGGVAAAIAELANPPNVPYTTTKIQITAAKFGLKRTYSEEVAETTIEGRPAFEDGLARDAGRLMADKVEDDMVALFASFTSSVSHTTLAMSLAYHLEAMAKLRTQKVPPGWVAVYSETQTTDLLASLLSSGGSVLANPGSNVQNILNADSGDGVVGMVFGVPTYHSPLTDTANAGADGVGAMYLDARVNERNAALGYAQLWAPRSMSFEDPNQVATVVTYHAAGAAGMLQAGMGTKIITRV